MAIIYCVSRDKRAGQLKTEICVFYRTILLIIFTIKFRNRKRDNIYISETSALQILIIIIIIIIIIILDSHFTTILFCTQEECTYGIYFNIHILESVKSLFF